METVLGLSLTSTSVGWVLVEGRDADGAILDHDDFDVHPTVGVQAVYTSEQASAAVRDVQAAARLDQRLHVVGVTWSDESAAEAALLVESLTDAGFDNIVPVRLHDACDMLARAIAPVVGYDQAAVCVLDGDSTIVVMVDAQDGAQQTAIKQLSGGPGHLVHWLTALFDRSSWQPGGIVVVGAPDDVAALSARLTTLPVPVITQASAELALARGAALASAHSTEFTDAAMLETVNNWRQEHNARPRSSAGAAMILAAGAVAFVASLSLALGPHLVPNHAPDPVRPFAHRAAQTHIAEVPPPAAVTPPARPAPKPPPEQEPVVEQHAVEQQAVVAQAPVELPAVAPVAPPAPPPPDEPPPNPHPLLTKLLQRLHGQDPDQPPPPPPPGAPTP
ncbi:hypothetical protein [Mycobacterium sp.]|uniref:DUF7159 family protein n=1 Tax=Mycobacterium sp. TaxID=1785 RepID=UPI0031DC9557